MSETRRRNGQVCVRLLPTEYDQLATAATQRGISPAELLRQALQHELETP